MNRGFCKCLNLNTNTNKSFLETGKIQITENTIMKVSNKPILSHLLTLQIWDSGIFRMKNRSMF